MKKLLIRLCALIIYLIVLLLLIDFKIWVLFDIKTMIMVSMGTGILTLSSVKRGMDEEEIKMLVSWNAMLTAYLTTFVLLFSRLSHPEGSEQLMRDVALNCRPLLYGLIINILIMKEADRKKQSGTVEEEDGPALTERADKLKEKGLTEREIEIAFYIYEGNSNKDIGDCLYISESTVKKHTTNLYRKLEINNREQLKQYIKKIK